MTDYYSNFISVKRLNSTTTTAVSKQLMELFLGTWNSENHHDRYVFKMGFRIQRISGIT